MNDKAMVEGLCVCCINESKCIFRTKNMEPVLQCEEFIGLNSSQDAKKAYGERHEIKKLETPETDIKGLCGSCAKFQSCTFKKDEYGVWECDEYE